MKQIIKLEEAEDFLSAAVEIWNVEDEVAQEKFEEVIDSIKKEYDLYETYEEYREIMRKYYNADNPTEEEYFDELERLGPTVKRLTPTEVFFDIESVSIRLKIVECTDHVRVDIG